MNTITITRVLKDTGARSPRCGLLFFVCLVLLTVSFAGTAVAQTTVTGCGTLDNTGFGQKTYVLEDNITDSPSDDFALECLDIDGSNIVLDGQGYTISSATSGDFENNRGITVNGGFSQQNVEIRNITLEGWERGGIYISGDETLVDEVKIKNVKSRGIRISPQYQDSTNTIRNTVIDGVQAGNVIQGGDGFGINARSLSQGTSNTYTNVTVRNTKAAELVTNDKEGDTAERYNVSGNLTSTESNSVNLTTASSVSSNPAAGAALGTYVGIEGSGFAENSSLFYDSAGVPADRVAAIWYHNGSGWDRLDTAKLGTSAGKSFVREDRNITQPPSGSVLGAYVSDILPVDADFSANPSDPIEGQFIEFDASQSNSPNDEIVEYRWDFGDGTKVNTTSTTVEHSYDSDGVYTVTLEAVDGVGESNTTTRAVSVDRAERYYAGGDGATRTYQIANWTHLDNVREVPRGNFELIRDLDNETAGYDEVARTLETNFTDGFDSVLFPPEQKELARSPIVASSVKATDLGDGSTVGVNVVDAQNGTVEITEETNGRVEVSYDTQSPTVGGFDPIGGQNSPFSGELNGNGYTIGDLFVEEKRSNVGLFGYTGSNTALKNVSLADANVTVFGNFDQDNTGTLVGYNDGGTIEDSSANGTVDAQSNVGGLVGYNKGGTVRGSSSGVDVTAGYNTAAGLVGRLVGSGTVKRSSATGDVRGDSNAVAGLVGELRGSSTVTESYATGNVSPVSGGSITRSGGLVGEHTDGTITNSYAVVDIKGGNSVGGLVGRNSANIEYSYAAGRVNSSNGGGLAGDSGFSTTVTDSYWDVNATGQDTTAFGDGTGLTTEEMKGSKAKVNMSGFDFANTWGTVSRGVSNSTQEIAYPVLSNNTQAPEPGLESITATDNFTVVIDDYTAVARPGNEIAVNATLENVGLNSGTQTVKLSVNGTVESTTSVSLDPLETEGVGFSYSATDSDRPQVMVAVASENDSAKRNVSIGNAPPSANDDSYSVQKGSSFTRSEPGVLVNDTDANGDNLSVVGTVTDPSNGSLSINSNGSFEYAPNPGFVGEDGFAYEVTDGNETDTANVTLNVLVKDLRSISYNETKPGRIDDDDPSGFRGEYEPVTFDGAEGDNITATMTSDGDPYLKLQAPNGTVVAENDDSPELSDFNSRIKNFVLGDTGTYTIIATSYGSDARFKYNLSLEANSRSTGNFSVSIDSTNSPVTEGEPLDVTAYVENTGTGAGTQGVSLRDTGGGVADSEQVALGPGNSTTITLNWDTTSGDAGTGDVTVETENGTATETVEVSSDAPDVERANLSIGSFGSSFPNSQEGSDYGDVEIPVEETNDTETQDLNVTLGVRRSENSSTFTGYNDTEALRNETRNFTFGVGTIDKPDTYTATVTANATNANETTESVTFDVFANLPFFDVNITGTNSPVVEGETLSVNGTVDNTGNETGEQNLSFTESVTGDAGQVGSAEFNLSPNETESFSLNWTTSTGDNGTGEVSVVSDNDTESIGVNVVPESPANFSVEINGTNSPVEEGKTLGVDARIENVGGENGTQTVSLTVGGTERDSKNLSLGAGDSTVETFEWQSPGVTGDYTASVSTENDTDTTTVTVEEPEPEFRVEITDTNQPVEEDETLFVDAEAENVGGGTDTQTIELEVGGETKDVSALSLSPAESTGVGLSTGLDAKAGEEVTVTVLSEDDTDSRPVEVVDASGDEGGDPSGGSSDDDSSPPEPSFAYDFEAGSTEPTVGDTVTFSGTVEMTDGYEATAGVELEVDGDSVDSAAVDLIRGESTEVGFEHRFTEAGRYEVSVSGDYVANVEVRRDASEETNQTEIGEDTEDENADSSGDRDSDETEADPDESDRESGTSNEGSTSDGGSAQSDMGETDNREGSPATAAADDTGPQASPVTLGVIAAFVSLAALVGIRYR